MPTDDDRAAYEDPSLEDTATSSESHAAVAGFESADAPLEPFGEVLSGAMDAHDPDSTGELDLPGVDENLNPHPAEADPGFDGWLDDNEASAKADDPYASLSGSEEEDDGAAEIADWMAFTSSAADEPAVTDDVEVVVDVTDKVASDDEPADADPVERTGDETDKEEVPLVQIVEPDGDEPAEDTVELFLDDTAPDEDDEDDEDDDEPLAVSADEPLAVSADEPSDETQDDVVEDVAVEESVELDESDVVEEIVVDKVVVEEFVAAEGTAVADEPVESVEESVDSTEDADPEKLAVLPIVPIGVAAAASDSSSDRDSGESADADDDTGEIPIVGFGASATGSDDGPTVFDGEDFTQEHYLDAATSEHRDLAAAIVAAESQDTEQVALSAAIPGLDAGVVGFDDVVDAHGGEETAPIAPPKSSDLVVRVGTAVALIAAFLLSLLWRPAIIVLALAAFVIAAGEFYSVLMHRRYKPLSIFGFLGIVGAGLGTVVWGVIAIPIAFALMVTVILLFDAVSQRRQDAVSGFALTILVAVWIGGLGAFAFPIIAADNYQALVLTVVGVVALVDIAAYFVGRTIGSRPFSPTISPKKTIEGFVGGTLMALLAGAAASFFVEAIDLPAGLVLGAVVAVFAPLGDLSVSVIKRSLNIKDMGSILPGHGGLLDRIDAILAVIPAAWAAFVWMGLL